MPQDNRISLNDKVGKCAILGKVDCIKVFQQALYNETELSVVTGLNNKIMHMQKRQNISS